MNHTAFSYPPMPARADKRIIKPSASFKKQVYWSIVAILFFLLSYLLLFAGALAIAVAFGLLGIVIMQAMSSFITLILGAALIGSGLMLVYFVIKFLFKRTRTDYSGMIEINEHDQPALFGFIRQLTTEAQAPFPKRVFISADVNAGVFYNSSFWSMFFPVKKNLKIGLGLVNSVNISEFKAIMAHEFGHFSQRSMKFGSYVYNLNKVIYNLLYDNEGYGKLLNNFAQLHSIFRLFALINIKIVEGMQAILKKVYEIVNKTYLRLSREMEFHADAVGAYVSGSNHMISSLLRTETGQLCYSGLLDYWGSRINDNKRAANFYPQQLEMIKHFADRNNLQSDSAGLPIITDNTILRMSSQIVINDQWSSHPTNEDREQHLLAINLVAPTVDEPAWLLFQDPEALQIQLTDDVYSRVNTNAQTVAIDLNGFREDFYTTISNNSFDKRYSGYYDGRNINQFDVDDIIKLAANKPVLSFDELFTEDNRSLPRTMERMEQDMSTLDTIISVRKDIKTFDYKGTKYRSAEAQAIRDIIENERHNTQQQIDELDRQIFIHFYNSAKSDQCRTTLIEKYRNYLRLQISAVQDYDLYNNIMAVFTRVYNTMPHEEIHRVVNNVYKQEKQLKPRIKEVIADPETQPYFSEEQLTEIDKYVSSNWVYFNEPTYDNEAIKIFNEGIGSYINGISKRNFELKKDLLNFQLRC